MSTPYQRASGAGDGLLLLYVMWIGATGTALSLLVPWSDDEARACMAVAQSKNDPQQHVGYCCGRAIPVALESVDGSVNEIDSRSYDAMYGHGMSQCVINSSSDWFNTPGTSRSLRNWIERDVMDHKAWLAKQHQPYEYTPSPEPWDEQEEEETREWQQRQQWIQQHWGVDEAARALAQMHVGGATA